MGINDNHNDNHIDCDHGLEEDEFTLALTRNEALYLDDCLTLMIEREVSIENKSILSTLRNVAPLAQLPVPIELIDKIAYAVLYTTDETNSRDEASIRVSVSELYLLREVSQSYIRIGEEAVGYNLKRKIYASLFALEYEQERTVDRMLDEALPPNIDMSLELEEIPENKKTRLP